EHDAADDRDVQNVRCARMCREERLEQRLVQHHLYGSPGEHCGADVHDDRVGLDEFQHELTSPDHDRHAHEKAQHDQREAPLRSCSGRLRAASAMTIALSPARTRSMMMIAPSALRNSVETSSIVGSW